MEHQAQTIYLDGLIIISREALNWTFLDLGKIGGGLKKNKFF